MECAAKFTRALSRTLTDEHEVRSGRARTRSKDRLFSRKHIFVRTIE
jgi:hypothetical protein